MAVFAGIVILIGIVFMISTLRGARKEKSHATSSQTRGRASSQPEPVEKPPAAFPSREGDAAYRDALRTFAKDQTRTRSGMRQSRSLSDDAYRDALRSAKKDEKPSNSDGS